MINSTGIQNKLEWEEESFSWALSSQVGLELMTNQEQPQMSSELGTEHNSVSGDRFVCLVFDVLLAQNSLCPPYSCLLPTSTAHLQIKDCYGEQSPVPRSKRLSGTPECLLQALCSELSVDSYLPLLPQSRPALMMAPLWQPLRA
jgi:hypothetical protein